MRFQSLFYTAIFAATAAAVEPDESGRYTLTADGIKAQFIPYGASLTNLFVKDKNGVDRDIVLGYDNTSFYPVDPGHPVLNAVPGRYVNRIRDGVFTLDNKTYHTEHNDGNNTLHSGTKNWSFRFWNVSEATKDSITFSLDDPAFSTDMPGRVEAQVTYTLTPNKWHIKMRAISPDVRTIIMLTQHTYFNLDAFANPSTDLVWNHTLYMPYGESYLEPDPNMVPTGKIIKAPKNSTNDFWSEPHQFGRALNNSDFVGNCGTASGCAGYNNQWLIRGKKRTKPVATLRSDWSGISAKLSTNQDGLVIYTCYWFDGMTPVKSTQGVQGQDRTIKSSGCVAIEAHDWVDGINHPEWNRMDKQVFGPGQLYEWDSTWAFSAS
ncbi:aldose 1-epimeras-like protein [Patellaria atrata CBS 101060]|uniref:Aldose 1-epimeras-like protein n=1 Tax=Patellaria atrata CBS 101060 TaxID=1346257 RepID=A0A9P4S415_9PEZI|nr:aldose 1-epimeras-like protein [Patellaria atrata CBS 101060]